MCLGMLMIACIYCFFFFKKSMDEGCGNERKVKGGHERLLYVEHDEKKKKALT